MHVGPPHPPTYLLCLSQTRMAAYFGEVSMERPGRFMNAGMLGIVVESTQDDTVTES